MEVAAENLANADATRTPEGGPYRRKQVILATTEARPAVPMIVKMLRGELDSGDVAGLGQVRVVAVAEDPTPPKRVYEPGHPDADAQGFVLMPNVDVPMEMADLIAAARAYEANATALQVLRRELERALELLR